MESQYVISGPIPLDEVRGEPGIFLLFHDRWHRTANVGGVAHASAHAPFGSAVAWAAAEAACEAADLDTNRARLIRLGENALFHLPGPNVVVRVARSMAYWEDVGREVAVARWLASQGFPAVRPYPDVTQPAEAAGRPVTFWEFIEGRNGNRGDIVVLAELLSRLHRLPHPHGFTLPADDPLGRVRLRLETTSVPTADKEFLLARLEAVEAACPGCGSRCLPGRCTGTRTCRT